VLVRESVDIYLERVSAFLEVGYLYFLSCQRWWPYKQLSSCKLLICACVSSLSWAGSYLLGPRRSFVI